MSAQSYSIRKQDYLKAKIKWLLILRIIVVTILLGSISLAQIRQGHTNLTPFYMLIAIIYLLTILYSVLYHYFNNLTVFAYIQLVGDILIETCLIYYTGGIESIFSFTYIVTILTASILLSRKGSLVIASLSSILYGLLLDLQYYEILVLPFTYMTASSQIGSSYVFHTIFVNICAFFLTALLSGYLAESRKKVDQELIASREDLWELKAFNEDILKNIRSGITVTDLQGRVTLINKIAQDLLDIGENDDASHWSEIFRPLDFHKVIAHLERRKDPLYQYNEYIDCGSRGTCFIGLTISLLKDRQGNIKGTITCFQDLTEFKNMEEQIKQADILATIGGMAAGIAHEIRNPLASIKGSIQLLVEGLHMDEEQKALMEIIIRESSHLNKIINDFLTYARPMPPNLQRYDINCLINETLAMAKNGEFFNKAIQLFLDLEKDNCMLDIDVAQFKQVLWNLTINACEAMPNGGTLSIRSLIYRNEDRDYKIFEFQDTGIGISKDQISRVFHPFYTTKERGTGLGLCTAYRIIEGHGGRIEVKSNPGKGSIFRIFFPLSPKIVKG